VLPSPVRISAILPSCSAMPPTSCTSKWRMPSTRLLASRTTANASGSTSFSAAPPATFCLSSGVFAASSASESACIAGSSALTWATLRRYSLRRRSLRLPKIALRAVLSTRGRRRKRGRCEARPKRAGNPKLYRVRWGRVPLSQPREALVLERRSDQYVALAERQELVGIQRDALLAHLEVQVRAGGAAGRADLGDELALHHHVAHLHEALGKVRVARREPVVVIDVDDVSVLLHIRDRGHHAARGRHHGRAGRSDDV